MLSLLLLMLAMPLTVLPGLGAVVVFGARGEPARGHRALLGVAILVVGEATRGVAWMASLVGFESALRGVGVALLLLLPVGNAVLASAGRTKDRPLTGVYFLGVAVLFTGSVAGYWLANEIQNMATVGLAIGAAMGATAWAIGGGGVLALASALALPRRDPDDTLDAPPSMSS